MMPTPRTQPYRAGAPREFTAALQAMLTGRQPGVVNGGDFARQRSQMQAGGGVQGMQDLAARELQSMQQRQRRPMATADVRGAFGTPAGSHELGALHELLAGLMGAQPGIVRRY